MKTFTPRMDNLDAAQRRLWPKLEPARKMGMVLFGGTAIALQLGHRHSQDFDFFGARPLDKEALFRNLEILNEAQVLQDDLNTLSVLVPSEGGSVKLSFFGDIPFAILQEPRSTPDHVAQVAGLDLLMATKLRTIQNREEIRDYQDIAEMVKAGVRVAEGLNLARKIWPKFSPQESLRALAYFGGEVNALPEADKALLLRAVKTAWEEMA